LNKKSLFIPEKLDAPKLHKRFYKAVSVVPDEDGFAIALDGRQLKSPSKRPLVFPTQALADVVAQEWDAQAEHIVPTSMPLMALMATAVDRIGPERVVVTEQIAAYGGSDLLCYRAEGPADLVALQAKAWDPWLTWIAEDVGASLRTTAGIIHVQQPDAALEAITKAVDLFDDNRLSALSIITAMGGSVVIGLAFLQGQITAAKAYEAVTVDEAYQETTWGVDAEAAARRAGIRAEFLAAEHFLSLLPSRDQ